jgi:hypothetical protein
MNTIELPNKRPAGDENKEPILIKYNSFYPNKSAIPSSESSNDSVFRLEARNDEDVPEVMTFTYIFENSDETMDEQINELSPKETIVTTDNNQHLKHKELSNLKFYCKFSL